MERLQELLAEAQRLALQIEELIADTQEDAPADEGQEADAVEAEAGRQRKLDALGVFRSSSGGYLRTASWPGYPP